MKTIEYTQAITNWLKNEKDKLRPYYIELGWSGENLEEVIQTEEADLDKYVETIYDAVTNRNIKLLVELYPYFENLSNNRRTAFLFRELTGVSTGTTNKSGIEAFNTFFGIEAECIIKKAEQDELDKEKQNKEAEENAKENQIKEYFLNPMWDISNLTNIQIARLQKCLNVQYRYSDGIKTLKTHLESINAKGKKILNNMSKWNRSKYNKMDAREQREYEKKLEEGRNYNICFNDGYLTEINKTIYDALTLIDETDYEKLEVA